MTTYKIAAHVFEPAGELIQTDLVGFGRVPGKVESGGPLGLRSDPVLPPVAGDKIAAGVANGRDAELAYELDHVCPESMTVGCGVGRFIDPVVHTAPEVFDERSEEAAVDGSEREARFHNEVR